MIVTALKVDVNILFRSASLTFQTVYLTGDMEKKFDLEISPLCNQQADSVPTIQIGEHAHNHYILPHLYRLQKKPHTVNKCYFYIVGLTLFLCFRFYLLHCEASVWRVAPLHRAQPAQSDHDGSPAQEQGPLEPPTIRTQFRTADALPIWEVWAWGRRWRGGRHPLIFLLFLGVFYLPV